MDLSTIREISFIASCILNKKEYSSIFDIENRRSYLMSYSSSSVFNCSTNQFLSISMNDKNDYTIFNYRTSDFINLKVDGTSFNGFDFASSSFYNGNINGDLLSFYSLQSGKVYQFSLV